MIKSNVTLKFDVDDLKAYKLTFTYTNYVSRALKRLQSIRSYFHESCDLLKR